MKYEIRPTFRRSGRVTLTEDCTKYTGFRSVYGFDKDGEDYIVQNGGTHGIRSYKLYSDTLFIDIDDNVEASDAIEAQLQEMGVGFDVYFTENRGNHFHIPIVPMYGLDTAYQQKKYVERTFIGADTSIYKSTGIIRLPGTFHFKRPGHKKHLIRSHEGGILTIPREDISPEVFDCYLGHDEWIEKKLDEKWCVRVEEGGRNRAIYNLAFMNSLANKKFDEALNNILTYNLHMVLPPLSDLEVVQTVKSAYRR